VGESAIPSFPDILVQLRRTQHAVRIRLDTVLAPTGVTTPQYAVLAFLEEGERSSSELARAGAVTAQTMNVMVAGLQDAGLVIRRRHPGHGRILLVGLTDRGRQALRRGRELAVRLQDQVLVGLSRSERAALLRSLEEIERAAGPAGPTVSPSSAGPGSPPSRRGWGQQKG
jgi:DNA-binding MarR family transcriptional regulator